MTEVSYKGCSVFYDAELARRAVSVRYAFVSAGKIRIPFQEDTSDPGKICYSGPGRF